MSPCPLIVINQLDSFVTVTDSVFIWRWCDNLLKWCRWSCSVIQHPEQLSSSSSSSCRLIQRYQFSQLDWHVFNDLGRLQTRLTSSYSRIHNREYFLRWRRLFSAKKLDMKKVAIALSVLLLGASTTLWSPASFSFWVDGCPLLNVCCTSSVVMKRWWCRIYAGLP